MARAKAGGEVRILLAKKDSRDVLAIAQHIGGSPEGPRGAIDRLCLALMARGVTPGKVIQDSVEQTYFERWRSRPHG